MVRPRTWSDDELTDAVASATSWSEVARSLNLAARGRNIARVRGYASRLGLSIAHLKPGPMLTSKSPPAGPHPIVSETRLREAVAGARSWAQVARNLGMPANRDARQLQALSKAFGIDSEAIRGKAWASTPLVGRETPFTQQPDGQLHRVGAAVAAAWFLARGYAVSVPLEPTTYDLVTESDDGLKKVQVKTSRTATGMARISCTEYGTGTNPSSGVYGRRAYQMDEVDFFFIYTAAGDKYLIPAAVVEGKRSLRLSRYQNFVVDK